MLHIRELSDLPLVEPTVVALGVFDGVHLGHQALITDMVSQAREKGLRTAVMTFFPHPKVVLKGLSGRLYLEPIEARAKRLSDLGIDIVVTNHFDQTTRETRAATYVEIMQSKLGMVEIWSGDFGFGYKREGTADYLRTLQTTVPFSVHHYDEKIKVKGERLSSSRIRKLLIAGEVAEANQCLGRPYSMSGLVVKGDQRGRTIGFPTANLKTWESQVIPAFGVYASWITLPDGRRFQTATNIGVRPTVDGQDLRVESHLLDFDGDLYGQTLCLEFVERIRGEKKFDGLDALKGQIAVDVAAIREILENS